MNLEYLLMNICFKKTCTAVVYWIMLCDWDKRRQKVGGKNKKYGASFLSPSLLSFVSESDL